MVSGPRAPNAALARGETARRTPDGRKHPAIAVHARDPRRLTWARLNGRGRILAAARHSKGGWLGALADDAQVRGVSTKCRRRAAAPRRVDACTRQDGEPSEKTAHPCVVLQDDRLPCLRVPAEHLALLHRFEREQAWERRIVANVERRVGRPVLRFQLVEEVARVHVERIILFHGATRVDHHVQLDGRLSAAAPAESAQSAGSAGAAASPAAAAPAGTTGGFRAELDVAGSGRRLGPDAVARGRYRRAPRPTHAV